MIDLEKVRGETPACKNLIHFNNAGASLTPTPVMQVLYDYLALEQSQGGYEAAALKRKEFEQVYGSLARLINCEPDEVALMENATRAWDMACYAINFKPGDKVLTGQSEYVSNYLAFLQLKKRRGLEVQVIPNNEWGEIDLNLLEQAIDSKTKLIALTHVPTSGGLVNPATEVGVIARKHKVLYLLDACQSVGQMPIDVQEIGCDFLAATGRKYLRGPRGTGFLYVSKKVMAELDPPFLELQSASWKTADSYQPRQDAKLFETWESYKAGQLALGRAAEYALELSLEAIQERVQTLAQSLREKLGALPGLQIHDQGRVQCGIVTFTCKTQSAELLQQKLQEQKVNTSVSYQKYAQLDLGTRNLGQVLRASVHYYNSESEVDVFCERLSAL